MPAITVKSRAAIQVIAVKLADLLTNSIITGCAEEYGLAAHGSNKVDRLRSMLEDAETARRHSEVGGRVLSALVLEAHARALAGKCAFRQETLEAILDEARVLSWDVRDLRSKGWRTAITSEAAPAASGPEGVPAAPGARKGGEPRVGASRYEEGLHEVARLVEDPSLTPQYRGIQLELVLYGVLVRERLQPQRNVVVPGEQIDLAFALDGQHYLVECKWLKDPVGAPDLSRLTYKVATRPVGVRGVMLSMTGFVRNAEDLVQRGGQQHCIGLDQQHVISVLEGRTTWADLVLRGWREAAIRRQFLAPR